MIVRFGVIARRRYIGWPLRLYPFLPPKLRMGIQRKVGPGSTRARGQFPKRGSTSYRAVVTLNRIWPGRPAGPSPPLIPLEPSVPSIPELPAPSELELAPLLSIQLVPEPPDPPRPPLPPRPPEPPPPAVPPSLTTILCNESRTSGEQPVAPQSTWT